MNNKKLKIILFALTGFGNTVLKQLINHKNVIVKAVITEKYNTPFPYYKEKHLLDFCREKQVDCYYDINLSDRKWFDFLSKIKADLFIVATFKKIFTSEIISLPTKGMVNIHPSLLPKYKGPCPTNHALLNGEKTTGVTIHYLNEKLDSGNILLQRSLKIEPDYNDGELRHKLAILAGNMITDLIDLFMKTNIPLGNPQDSQNTIYAHKPKPENGFLEKSDSIETIKNKINAYNPYPGTSILINGKRLIINNYNNIDYSKEDGIYEYNDYIDFFINGKGIRLIKQK